MPALSLEITYMAKQRLPGQQKTISVASKDVI